MACTRLEWSYNISLLGIYVQFPIEKNFAIYIHQNSSAILIQHFFNLNLKKVAKRKEHSLRNLEITTYTSCNGPQICLLQMHPLTEKFLFKETQTKKENTLYLVLYSYSPFQMNCKTERQGTLFYVFVQSTKQKPFNFLFCILKNSNDSRRMKTINKIIFVIPCLYFKHAFNLEYMVRQCFYIQKYANYGL